MPLVHRSVQLLLRLALRNIGRGDPDLVAVILLEYCSLPASLLMRLGTAGRAALLFSRSGGSEFRILSTWPLLDPPARAATAATICSASVQPKPRPARCAPMCSCASDALVVYSDASLSSRCIGGLGVWVPAFKVQRFYRITSAPNACVAELMAIAVALSLVQDLGVRKVVVVTDSKAAMAAIRKSAMVSTSCSPVVAEILQTLHALSSAGVAISICWCPGHAGIPGNEFADGLSREYLQEECQCIQARVGPRDLSRWCLSVAKTAWEESWFTSNRGRGLFSVHPSVTPPRDLDSLPRRSAVLLSRLRVDHSVLNASVAAWVPTCVPTCACGPSSESREHFLLECPLFAKQRRQFLAGVKLDLLSLLGVQPHTSKHNYSNLRAVAAFCVGTRRFGGSQLC